MPFTSGVFANVAGATSAAAGQTIQSTVWNNIHTDYSTAFNEVADQLAGSTTFKNVAWMNGGMEVWQRGTSIAVTAATTPYTADRWYILTNANQASVVSRQTGLADQSQFCARVQRNSGETGTGVMQFAYPLDTDEVYRLRGKFAYLTVKIRAGANWSPASGNITISLIYGTGAAAKSAAFAGSANAISQVVALTTTTQTLQIISSAVVPITALQAEINFAWTPVGTAGTNDYFEVDNVELVAVPVAASADYVPDDFEYLPFNVELDGCNRHYQKTFKYARAPDYGAGDGENSLPIVGQATEVEGIFWVFTPKLRTATFGITLYSILSVSASSFTGFNGTASIAATTFTVGERGVLITGTPATTAVGYGVHAAVSAGI